LEQMTVKMPTNCQDMMEQVFGMGPKKYESFGEAFLLVIQHYARKYARTIPQNPKSRANIAAGASTTAGTKSSRSSTGRSRPAVALFAGMGMGLAMATAPVVINVDTDTDTDDDDDNDDDDDVVPLESLSCTEIIQRKFQHAAANGYVISLE
jgi:hypothetical protein